MGTPTQLDLYNRALLACGERSLATLSEAREPRYLLDQVWDQNGVIECLEEGQWRFAMRAVQVNYDPTITPTWGYRRAFAKPADWVLTSGVCADEYLRVPLTRYLDERGYWFCELTTIYVRYISDDAAWGLNMALWPASFFDFVGCHFASQIIGKITQDASRIKDVRDQRKEAKLLARNRTAMEDPTTFPAQGSWTKARQRWLGRRDGGNSSGNLIG